MTIGVKEIEVKSVLSRCGIYGVDYSINPYIGCGHGCAYCFARYVAKKIGRKSEEWGSFVYVKRNAPTVLKREIVKKKRGTVLMSSVTDPYQPLERKYNLTRKLLEILAFHDFPLTILTKSPLVLRDVSILKRLSDVEVGFTIVTLDERARACFESHAPPIVERLEALRQLKKEGISTFVMLGPILPGISDRELKKYVEQMADLKIDYLLVDRLNLKAGNWTSIKRALLNYDPKLLPLYEQVLFRENDYFDKMKDKIGSICKRYGIECVFCY